MEEDKNHFEPQTAGGGTSDTKRTGWLVAVVGIVVVIAVAAIYFFGSDISVSGPGNLPEGSEAELQEKSAAFIERGDAEGCEDIGDETYRAVCANNIYINQAVETGDVLLCQKMDGKLVSTAECERRVVQREAIATNDLGKCMEATIDSVKGNCIEFALVQLAIDKNDISLCDKIGSDAAQDCRNQVIAAEVAAGTVVDCSQAGNTNAREDCKKVLAEGNVNCGDLQTFYFREVCSRNARQ